MAKKPPAPQPAAFGEEPPAAPGQPKQTPIERDEQLQQQKTLRILETHRDTGSYIEIHCRPVGEMDYGFLAQIRVEAYSLPHLAEKFGGGDYKLIAKTGEHKFLTTWFATVDHSVPAKRAVAAAAAPQSDTAAIVKQVVDAMRRDVPPPKDDTIKDFMPALVAAISRPPPDSSANLEMFKLMMEQNAKAEARMMTLIKEMRDSATPAKSLKDQLEEIATIKEMFDTGTPEKKSEMIDLVKALAPAAAPLIQHLIANGQAQPQLVNPGQPQLNAPRPAAPAAHAGTGAAQTIDAQTQTVEEPSMQLDFILNRFRKSALETAAKPDADPVEFALDTVRIVETWAPEQLPKVFAAANSEEWFAQIFGQAPEAMKHAEFLREMRNAILSRSVVFIARNEFTAGALPPEHVAQHILKNLSPSYAKKNGYLFDETDPENWASLFDGEQIDGAWLEALRVALDAALSGDGNDMPVAPAKPTGPLPFRTNLSGSETEGTPPAGEIKVLPAVLPAAPKRKTGGKAP